LRQLILNFYVEDFFSKAPDSNNISWMRKRQTFVGFINIRGARINESAPLVNRPEIGIYLNPRVEMEAQAAIQGAGSSIKRWAYAPTLRLRTCGLQLFTVQDEVARPFCVYIASILHLEEPEETFKDDRD
jgi:hypothetical protein